MAAAKITAQRGLGVKVHEAKEKVITSYDDRVSDICSWIDEYIADAKSTFNT